MKVGFVRITGAYRQAGVRPCLSGVQGVLHPEELRPQDKTVGVTMGRNLLSASLR